jgi:hypothetical protein
MSDRPGPPASPRRGDHTNSDADAEPVLPEQTRDDRDLGWGDEPGERDAEWYRRERPPHHGD